jgi:2-deoxy-D-gluconate 3-dehydrogenase
MQRTEVLQGLRRMKFEDVYARWQERRLSQAEAAEILTMSERVVARTPAGRWGTPEDFAGSAVWLASRASDFVTGAAIPVDGGYSVQG